jgi:hypothetical protein
MKIVKYNHFDSATQSIAEGQAVLNPFLILETADATPADYTDVTGDIDEIEYCLTWKLIDYLTATILIKTAVTTLGFATLSVEHKALTARKLCTDDATIIAHHMGLGMSLEEATAQMELDATYHATDNAEACDGRFLNKKGPNGWFLIMIHHFGKDESLKILEASEKYMSRYRKYAMFGIGYGDTELGFMNFLTNTGGILSSIESYTLLNGVTDYTAVKTALTKFFFI